MGHIPESSLCKALVKMPVLSMLCAWSFSFGGQLHLKDGSLLKKNYFYKRQSFQFQIPTAGTYPLGIKVVTVSLFALNFPCFLVSLFEINSHFLLMNTFS